MAGIGALVDLIKGLSDEAAALASKANLNDSAKLMLKEILEELPESKTPLRDYNEWISKRLNEGDLDAAAVAILKNADSYKTVVRVDSAVNSFSKLDDILKNGGDVQSTDAILNNIISEASKNGSKYNLDELNSISGTIKEMKKANGITHTDAVPGHVGTVPTPANSSTTGFTGSATTTASPPAGGATGATTPPAGAASATATASSSSKNIIPKASRNIFQHLGRFHFTNWGIPFTNIDIALVTKKLPFIKEITNAKLTMPNLFVRRKFIRPMVEHIDNSIKSSNVMDAAVKMEADLKAIANELSNANISIDDAKDQMKVLFEDFANANSAGLDKLKNDTDVLIDELKARILESETPKRAGTGVEDLSLRQKETAIKYLEDIRTMASSLSKTDVASGNVYLDEFLKKLDDAGGSAYAAADPLKFGAEDRFSRLGTMVNQRANLGKYMYEDVVQLERGIASGSYQRTTRYTQAAKSKGNNVEVDFGNLITFFKKHDPASGGKIAWTEQESKDFVAILDRLHNIGYPDAANRGVELAYSYMGRNADFTLPDSVEMAIAELRRTASTEKNANKLEFLDDLQKAIADKPHSNTEFGHRDMQRKWAELESFLVYGTYFSQEKGRSMFGLLDSPGLPFRSMRDTYLRSLPVKMRAYLSGTTTQVVPGTEVGSLSRLTIDKENISYLRGVKNIGRDFVVHPARTIFSGGLLGRTGRFGLGRTEATWSLSRHARNAVFVSGGVGGLYYGGTNLYEKMTGNDIQNNDLTDLGGFALGVPDLIATGGTKAIDWLLPGDYVNGAYESIVGKRIGFGSFMSDGSTPTNNTNLAGGNNNSGAGGNNNSGVGGNNNSGAGGNNNSGAGGNNNSGAGGNNNSGAGNKKQLPADAERDAALAQYRNANSTAALALALYDNAGSADDSSVTTGATQNLEIMAQQLAVLDEVRAKMIEDGKIQEADDMLRLRSSIEHSNLRAQSTYNEMKPTITEVKRISDEVQKLNTELLALGTDPADDARQKQIEAQLKAYDAELKPHEALIRAKSLEIAALRAENANNLGNSTYFNHYSGWRGDVNEGLIKFGGGKYGLANQLLGTDGPDVISVVEGYGQAGLGYIKGIGEWWQKKKDNTRSQSERNWLNGIETGGTILAGIVGLNLINSLTGNKIPPALKWTMIIGIVAFALHRSGKIGNEMAKTATVRKKSRFPGAAQSSASAHGGTTGKNIPTSLTGKNPDGTPIKEDDMVSKDTRTAAERKAAGECILEAEPCKDKSTKLTDEQIDAVNASGQGSTDQTVTQDHKGGMPKTPDDIDVSGMKIGLKPNASGTNNLPISLIEGMDVDAALSIPPANN